MYYGRCGKIVEVIKGDGGRECEKGRREMKKFIYFTLN